MTLIHMRFRQAAAMFDNHCYLNLIIRSYSLVFSGMAALTYYIGRAYCTVVGLRKLRHNETRVRSLSVV